MSDPGSSKRDETLSAVVERHGHRLLSFIRSRMSDPVEAEDVFQDVLAELVEAYDLGNAIDQVSAWFVRVAKNKIVDRFRRDKTQRDYRASFHAATDADETSPVRPDQEWMLSWLRREIINALEMLPPEQQDVFIQHELEGRSFAEIAAESGVSINTLLSRKRYAVLFLRDQLREIYDELE